MTTLKHVFVIGLIGCGTEPASDTEEPPIARSAIEKCIDGGGSLAEAWSVSNQHGPVTTIVARDLIVLGGADGSVKQWTLGGDGNDPEYGVPFTRDGLRVDGLALDDEHVVAASADHVTQWRLADATAMPATTSAGDVALSAVDITATGVFAGTFNGNLYALPAGAGAPLALEGQLWAVNSIAHDSKSLVTAGHIYQAPAIERRALDNPMTVVDRWTDGARESNPIHSVAIGGDRLVAGGQGLVAVLATDNLAAGPIAIKVVADHNVVGIALLPGRSLFVTAGSEGTLRLWNTETGEQLASLPIQAPAGLAVDREGTRLFTSGEDGKLHAFGCR